MTWRGALLGLLLLSASPGMAGTKPAERPLEASSGWLMDYDGDRCVLSREFGSGTDAVLIRFIRYAPEPSFTLQLVGRRFATSSRSGDVSVRFGEAGKFASLWAMAGTLGGRPLLIMKGRLDNLEQDWQGAVEAPVSLEAETKATSVAVNFNGRHSVMALGSMEKPMAALRTCETALVKQWGLDPAEQAALQHPPIPLKPPNTWLTPSDFPSTKAAEGQSGVIWFRLMVGTDGIPTACSVQSNVAKDGTFAATTCSIMMRRARFQPALSASGVPIASYYVNRARWVF